MAIVDGCVTFFAFLSCVFKILIIQRKQAIIRPPPFHVSQLYFILDQLETLFSMFDMFANGLQDGMFSRSLFEYESICRFSAQLSVLANDRSADTPGTYESDHGILSCCFRVARYAAFLV